MFGLTGVKIAASVGGMAAVLVAGVYLAWLVKDHRELATANKAHLACATAVERGTAAAVKASCDLYIAAAVEVRDWSAACDSALTATPENLFAARSSCTSAVQRVIAERDATKAELVGANTELNTLRADQADAVRRAEARGQAQAQSESHAKARIAALPPGGDGLRTCDAECLRHLTDPAG